MPTRRIFEVELDLSDILHLAGEGVFDEFVQQLVQSAYAWAHQEE